MQNSNQFVAEIMMTSGKVSDIDVNGAKYVGERAVIAGITSAGEFVKTDVHEIADPQISKIDTGLSVLAFLGTLGAIGVIVLSIVVIQLNKSFK